MASIKTISGKWMTCSIAEAEEYAAYLRRRYANLDKTARDKKVNDRIIFTKGKDDK